MQRFSFFDRGRAGRELLLLEKFWRKHLEPGWFFPLQAGPHYFPERYSYISFFAGKKHGKAKSKKPLTSKTIFVMFGNDVYRSIMPNI
jgi:hypothetical protein